MRFKVVRFHPNGCISIDPFETLNDAIEFAMEYGGHVHDRTDPSYLEFGT